MMFQLSLEFWLQTGVYLIGGTCAVIAVAYRIGVVESKFATKTDLTEKVQERNEKLDRIIGWVNNDFVRKDMCCQMHSQSRDDLKRIDDDTKAFRNEIRNTVQKIFDTIDELRRLITEKK